MGENAKRGALKLLKDEAQVREKAGVIFGTVDEYGCAHAIYEILANAIDEAMAGYGNEIRLSIMKNGEVTVMDFGRGLPMDWNDEEGMYDWQIALCNLYGSGKYDSALYTDAIGTNGLGLTATQYASEYMHVKSVYDNKIHTMNFRKGKPLGEYMVEPANGEPSGTTITFRPDPEVFVGIKENTLPPEYYVNLLRRQAIVCQGVKFVFYHEAVGKEIVIQYEEGAKEFIDSIMEKPMIDTAVFSGTAFGTENEERYPDKYQITMKFAFNFSRELRLEEMYHNTSYLSEGGTSTEGMRLGVRKAFTDYARETGKLNSNDSFSYKDIESIIVCIGITTSPSNMSFFKNQTKLAINSKFIGNAFANFVYNNMMTWLRNDSNADRVLTEVLTNKKARENAEKVSRQVIRKLSKAVKFGEEPEGLVDCTSDDPFRNELYIVEGKSALGSVLVSRNEKFQAVFPLRGKTLNPLKNSIESALKSDILINLFRTLGCGMEVQNSNLRDLPKFDISKLRYNKIIICTDADLDGGHIRCLVLAALYVLAPSLLRSGKVYIAETPLFTISNGGDRKFAYTVEEKDAFVNQYVAAGVPESRLSIQRSKGLGENSAEMMALTTMNPATRRLIRVAYDDSDSVTRDVFEALLGDDLESRRMLIDEYFEMTDVDID